MAGWERELVSYLAGDRSSLETLEAAAEQAEAPDDARTWLAVLRAIDASGRAAPAPGRSAVDGLLALLRDLDLPAAAGWAGERLDEGADDDDDIDADAGPIGAALRRIASPSPEPCGLESLLARLRDEDDVAAPFDRDEGDDVSPITGVDFAADDVPDVKAAGKDMGEEEGTEEPRD